MSESAASTMATRYVTCVILGCILFVLQPNSQTLASPLSIGNFSVSDAVGKVGKAINGAKNFLGFGQGSTTEDPPTTTKTPLYIVLIPKGFSKKVKNASENETTSITTVLTTPKPTKSNGFIEKTKSLWTKAKNFGQKIWTKSTTSPPPRNVWLVPVDYSKLRATRSPCSKGHNGQGCLSSSSQVAGFSWWMLFLSLTGALLLGITALFVFRRRWPGALSTPPDSIKVRPPKLPWPWYPSGPDCTAPRAPAPAPAALKTTGGPLSAVKMTPGPPPSWPAPPVPASNRANSLYQTTPAAAGHVYATPTATPYSAWASNANEHVHIYETPPCFPSYDLADQEIDTTALKKAAFDPKRAKC